MLDDYLENKILWALGARRPLLLLDPSWRAAPADVKAMITDSCPYVYYSPNRPLGLLLGASEGFPVERWAFTRQPIALDRLISLELVPVSNPAISALALAYFHGMWGEQGVYLLMREKEGTTEWDAIMIHPSTYESGRWQVSRLDHRGPSGHRTVDDLADAIAEEILAGFRPVAPDALDGYVFELIPPP